MSAFKTGSNWQEYREFSPSGLVPCLVDNKQIVWDSMGISEYLAEKHPEVWPQEVEARTWARCAAAEMHSGFFELRNQCPMNCGIRVELKTIDESLKKDIARIDELWNDGLSRFQGPFLAGEKFTAVDAFYAPVGFRIKSYGLNMSASALKYVDFLLSRPSLQLWLEGALKEPWREPEHEQDSVKSGVLVDGFRGNASYEL